MLMAAYKRYLALMPLLACLNLYALSKDPFEHFYPLHLDTKQHISYNTAAISCSYLLRALAELNHLNIILANPLRNKISVYWQKISKKQALQQTLAACGLHMSPHGHTVHVLNNPIRTLHHHTLAHQTLKQDEPFWQQLQRWVKPPSRITLNQNPSTIWLWGTSEEAYKIRTIIQTYDHPKPQVLVQATWVTLDAYGRKNLGLSDTSTSIINPNILNQLFNLNHLGQLATVLSQWGWQQVVKVVLGHLSRSGHAKVLASPAIITEVGHRATISTGILYPYLTKTSRGSQKIEFKPIQLSLTLTPYYLPDGWIELSIHSTQNQLQVNPQSEQPVISTHNINTTIKIRANETYVLGGVSENRLLNHFQGQTLFSTIPILNLLTSNQQISRQDRRLFILITPKLWRPSQHHHKKTLK